MNHTIIDGKPYVVGEVRIRQVPDMPTIPALLPAGSWLVSEVFNGEGFVLETSQAGIEAHNKALRDIYRRLDALESKVK